VTSPPSPGSGLSERPDIPGLSWPIVPATPRPLADDLEPIMGLIQSHRTGPARVRLKNHLNLHPDDAQAVFLFGLSYHREKRYQLARESFDRAIALDPNYPLAYYFKAWALYYLGELHEARTLFLIHHAFQPDVADSIFGLGLLDLEDDQLDGAEARFREALELLDDDPKEASDRSKINARLGDVFAKRGQLEEARRYLERSVELFPDHYEAWWMLHRVLVRLGDTQAADAAKARHDEVKQRLYPRTSFPE
jgi:tetratricopeptide (TPR) repeat protein